MIDPCEPVLLDHCYPNDGCCTDKAGIELLGNLTLQGSFSDRAVVRRVLGDLWFVPRMGTITSPADIETWMVWLNQAEEFLGLRIGEVNSQTPNGAPLFDIWNPAYEDLSEGQWKKTWQRFLDGNGVSLGLGINGDISIDLNMPASDVHTTGSTIPGAKSCSTLASGSGSICIDTSIDCEACPQGFTAGAINWSSSSSRFPPAWHVHLDVKKRLSLRENQVLYLVYNLRHYDQGSTLPANDSFTAIYGNVRCLVEMG